MSRACDSFPPHAHTSTRPHMRRLASTALPAGLLLCLLGLLTGPARGQPTNVEVLQALAVACLADVPDTAAAFRMAAPERAPYLRPALVDDWQRSGRTVYLPDTTAASALPRLAYDVEDVEVAYARARGRRVQRRVALALRYTWTGADGRILAEDRCRDARTDTLDRRDLAAVEDPAFPEATAEPPPAGWLRRYVEPAVLVAATAVGVYLFFTLRSQADAE